MLAIVHGSPRPRNTFTELLPLTFPTELSAVFSIRAAVLLANVSGILVPNATKVIAVILSSRPIKHPNVPAKSLMIVVRSPITPRDNKKHGQPPKYFAGGTNAKIN
jgi:hypothetical protein